MAGEWAPIDDPGAHAPADSGLGAGAAGPPARPPAVPPSWPPAVPPSWPPAPPAGPYRPPSPPLPRRGDRRVWAIAGVVAVGVLAAGGAILAISDGGGGGDTDREAPGSDVPSGAVDATEALAAATDRLRQAGTFAYEGTLESAPDGGADPLASAPLVDRVTGTMALPDRYAERVDPGAGDTTDHLTVGGQRWSRWSYDESLLDDRPWITETPDPESQDARAILGWLSDATEARSGRHGPGGARVIEATVRASDLPAQMTDATLEVTLGGDGAPRRVVFEGTDGEWVNRHTYDLSDLGADVDLQPLPADRVDHTPSVREEDLATVEDVEPVGLAGPPEGWQLVAGFVEVPDGTCHVLNVDYVGPAEASLHLDVTLPRCALGPEGAGEATQVGPHPAHVVGDGEAATGAVEVGGLVVVFEATGVDDLDALLGVLGPFDPAAQAMTVP